ncbi:restriction endonuclease [Actinacidiphila epipremni]|uniref:Restriction endonuclease n=1 Tax=Actinacidiphila epipremni TaxID=2053013 RepID=A0ABX0ZUB5_9ACTN|nr:restriction endonuclease [Actinacidiphila epipremni]NJP46166.1 restriction endonuclease [Actinacidiphila epipremni]
MSRRSTSGPLAVWAEAQRQQQRQREAQAREQSRQQRERERQQRAYEQEVSRRDRERTAEYRRLQEAEADRRTTEIEARVAELGSLLATGCRAPAFGTARLARSEQLQPFDPGPLAQPVRMPDPRNYQPAQQGGWGGARRAQQEAQARYAHDLNAAQQAEAQRQQHLAGYRRQYDQWAAAQLTEIRRHNAGIADVTSALRRGEAQAVVEYFSAALYASTAWPADLPRQVSAAYDPGARQLVLTWELPAYDVVPDAKNVRYLPSVDRFKESARPVTQRRALYRDLLAQCVLLALRDLFAADETGALSSVALSGFVDGHDPATGQRSRVFLASVTALREDFDRLQLARVSAVDCLVDGLRGQLATRPDSPSASSAIRPGRLPEDVGGGGSSVVSRGDDEEEPDLFTMDPLVFETLVADLFRAMGMQAVTTQRSGDGGVDVDALDPTPITGGTIVVQVKRYRHTVPPTAVRDLFGTVQHTGANKGVLVTTSRFGPTAHTFAHGKPLELVSGEQLVELLHAHGLSGRLGTGEEPAAASPASPAAPGPAASGAGGPAGPAAPATAASRAPRRDRAADRRSAARRRGYDAPEEVAEPAEHNVLALRWSGDVPLDVCALVCRGTTALSDEHFVFYNNPRTPDGTVASIPAPPPDRAALRVAFDALPARADRLVLAAALDPTAATAHTDLTAFTNATLRLLDADRGELGSLAVSEGRPHETALVLGSFRRRASGDWDFVAGGKGYLDGLEALIRDFGIDAT